MRKKAIQKSLGFILKALEEVERFYASGYVVALQRFPHYNPWNLYICYLVMGSLKMR